MAKVKLFSDTGRNIGASQIQFAKRQSSFVLVSLSIGEGDRGAVAVAREAVVG